MPFSENRERHLDTNLTLPPFDKFNFVPHTCHGNSKYYIQGLMAMLKCSKRAVASSQ